MLYNRDLRAHTYDQQSITVTHPNQIPIVICQYPADAIDRYFNNVDMAINDIVHYVNAMELKMEALQERVYELENAADGIVITEVF